MAIEHYRHRRPERDDRDDVDPGLLAMVRIILAVGALAVVLWVLNHLV